MKRIAHINPESNHSHLVQGVCKLLRLLVVNGIGGCDEAVESTNRNVVTGTNG